MSPTRTTRAMSDLAARIKQYGLTQVYCSPEKPLVDIVFVHGLNGDPYHTWTSKNTGTFWPAELLPEVLAESRVRILTYGYNANVTAFTDGASKDRVHNHAETLASGLAANRNLRGCPDRPIIFVCHSLGGLVVKRTLIYCRNVSNEKIEHLRSVYVSTYGILFLGTPHNGSDVAKWGLLLQNICSAVMPKKFMESSPQLVKTLKTNNETLQNINSLFADITSRFHIYFFHETLSSDIKGTRELIVDESSAAPYMEGVERMGIEADHSHMCKFDDDNSPGYEAVAEALLRYSRDAPNTIYDRWVEEEKTRRVQKQTKVRELFSHERVETETIGRSVPDLRTIGRKHLLPDPASSITLNDYEVEEAPERRSLVTNLGESTTLAMSRSLFLADPLFVELDILHSRVFRAKKRAERLMAVLICGGPGSGKSHLARQYVWTHRDSYPGGIFWVDAKSRQSTFKCFWDIAQAATLTDGQEFEVPDTNTSQKYVEAVRNWMQNREEWLLVFDGISFAHENDLNHFKQFLPFNKKCSIVYTSVDKTLRKKQRLYEPYCLKVRPLEVKDACRLLFEDLGIRKPTKAQIFKGTELVTHYECLPLAIHAISHRLSATSKPMEKYHIDSHLTDEKLAEPFLSIMHDLYQTEQFEALNLINLVSFFSHHVPVGLIKLGMAALHEWNVNVLASSRRGEPGDMDSTLGILIRYGLVERVSDSYALQGRTLSPQVEKENVLDVKLVVPDLSESQTEGSQDTFFSVYQNSGTIDVIKIHSVVQGFCRDELKIHDEEERSKQRLSSDSCSADAGFYDSWLIVASHVLCTSYGSARSRMERSDDCGLVKDLREYETHASRIFDYFPKRSPGEPVFLKEARDDIRQVLKDIAHEIDRISPNSSQESIRRQRSVFDRSSSSSSSIPESTTEEGAPRWEWSDMATPPVESPQEMPTQRQRVNLKPFLPHIFRESSLDKDAGYETDRESSQVVVRSSPALSQLSQATERPKSSQASGSSPPMDDRGWHLVKKQSKPKLNKEESTRRRPRFPRNIRSSQLAAPILKIFPVEGRSASSSTLGKSRRSSLASASDALTAVQHSSPPPYSRRQLAHRPSIDQENAPTYATVAARQNLGEEWSTNQRSSSNPGGKSRPTLLQLQNRSSGESLHSRVSNAVASPLSAEFKPNTMTQSTYSEPDNGRLQQQLNALDLGITPEAPYRTRHLSTARPIAPPVADMSASEPSIVYLPPPPPLPYEKNIEISSSRRVSAAQAGPIGPSVAKPVKVSHPSAFMPGISPPGPMMMDPTAGYTSEPAPEMARNISGQSQHGVPKVLAAQHAVSGTGGWLGEVSPPQGPSRPMTSARQPEISYAGPTQMRQIHPLEGQLAAVDPVWAAELPTLHFGAHRVDVGDARQRVGAVPVQYPAAFLPPTVGYPMYHPNLSGPLIPHEVTVTMPDAHGLRVRSGSSPPRPNFTTSFNASGGAGLF
ncbi:catalytic protein [Aspergillus heteromorphus CBS 117.55]|uniref:Catalytic protein n=1 Tax=Aspergillus heteromorphus CBS 117.55 TaxID=1448321 RepID=A0A317X4F3_9EURO|nr:catalytic protein [Aspergillus heteromorphus CBS 117.55]PWY92397.1 catalytic protein [Aspergillus heteromorphus CBS 117.55]